MKPELNEVLSVVELKNQITKLYEQLDEKSLNLFEKYGEGRFDYEYTDPDDPTKEYLKFEIKDVIAQLSRGETVWRSSSTKPVDVSFMGLKNKPKGL